jgi:chemotaxis protein MotB
MSAGSTSRPQEEGSYLASVSDLMSGLIFIFIIALVTFALGLREEEQQRRDEVERLQGATKERQRLLESIKDDLERAGIKVTIAPEQGVLRLGESLLFPLGRADLQDRGEQTVARLAHVLLRVLPCYTNVPADMQRGDCGERGKAGQLDAIFVEGHTDDLPIRRLVGFSDNWDLSSARAKTIFQTLMLASGERLDALTNQDGQRVLGVSAYADRRGVVPNDSDANRSLNRRIDLRFVMVPPKELVLPAAETKREMGG